MIDIQRLKVRYENFQLGPVDLEIPEGIYFILLGPTGSGKSVLLETIVGLNKSAEGRILIDGRDIVSVPLHQRNIGFVFQEQCLFVHKTVFDNIAYSLRIRKFTRKEIKTRVMDMAQEVNVTHLLKEKPTNLSGGERQRVSLARTLITGAKYLLLDEPLSSIDANGRADIRKLLSVLKARHNLTVLHVTHDLEDALALADRIGVINEGKLIEVAAPEQLLKKPGTHFSAQFLGHNNIISGHVNNNNGTAMFISSHNDYILPPLAKKGHAYMIIGPEHILLSRKPVISSARNCVKGRIKSMTSQQYGTTRVEVDAGDTFQTIILTNTLKKMDLNTGDEIYMSFKSSAIHVIERCE